ncbi:MAG TPA: rhodanese-like domain-containing protein [Thermoanaerobaculia bacterium]|jgi:rhodanese-related sulfurtransferase|nr:rhodanese-like domain-containing protein [Thermoanaerobaculia bacterium]
MIRGSNLARVVVLLVLAAGGAAISNLAASTERRLAWVGSYPRALEVAPAGPVAPSAPSTPTLTPAVVATVSPPASLPTEIVSVTPAAAATPLAPPAGSEADLTKSFPPHPDKAAVEIVPSDVRLLYARKALFLDARRSSVYAEGHIAGARSFPVWESDIDSRVKKLYEEGLDQKAPVVIYCSGGNCEDSHMLAEKLYMVGFDNVLIYKDGFPDWQKRGLPVSKGENP